METEIVLTEEQEQAVQAAVDLLTSGRGECLTIGGLAGTGKTTIIKQILERTRKIRVDVSAFTGKAVSVLRSKGVYRALTLHSLMYIPDKRPDGSVEFVRRDILDSDAVIVDEASMINTSLYQDLLAYGVPVVFIGDHGQLEPIGDNPGVMENPEIKLEQIHRQAGNSPVLFFAHLAREGKKLNWETVPQNSDLQRVERIDAKNICHKFDAIICGFNKTRLAYNSQVRKNRHLIGPPNPGERLICLKNSRSRPFFNGMMFTVKEIKGGKSVKLDDDFYDILVMDIETDDGQILKNVEVYMTGPGDKPGEMYLRYWDSDKGQSGEVVVADFGYALTAHKSQGSEFDSVMVIEEIWYEKWDPRRWRYTAATRAAKKLTWVT